MSTTNTTPTTTADSAAATPDRLPTGDIARPGGGRRRTRLLDRRRWSASLWLLPLLLYVLAFYVYPLARNIDLSVHDYTIRAFVQGGAEFVGVDNYLDVFNDRNFWSIVFNTVFFVGASLLFQYWIGLALAVFFHKSFPLSNVLRAMFLVPWLLPLIVSASSWSWMLNTENGIVNAALGVLGVDPVSWLTSPEWALVSVTVANIWLGIPFNLVILYAGLQNISEDLYEAAAIDGATAWQQFWRISFPLLKPVTMITLLLGLIYTLKVVDIIWIMTTGGPASASTTLAIWSYREAFGTGQPDFSPAAAVGNLLIVIALLGGTAYLWLQRREARA